MFSISYCFIGSLLCSMYFCLPPHQRLADDEYDKLVHKEQQDNQNVNSDLEQLGIEYSRYLKQVVETLEKDDNFRKKLEAAEDSDIKSAKIAEELQFVSHHIRSKLDELKRTELKRLRDLAKQAYNSHPNDIHVQPPGHLDHENPHSFEVKDLKKLIRKVVEDLEETDKKRREMFKNYEMQKHFEREMKLQNMTLEERNKFLIEEEAIKKKEKEEKKFIHHPGSKQQLEEVWEKQDHMNKDDFNARTFFYMHDIDGNGFLDEEEIKTLFLKELDKAYSNAVPEPDLIERAEEMERMREHIFNEVDKNKDRLISWEEFYAMSLQPEFNQDSGWKSLDEQQLYTQEELEAFERQRMVGIHHQNANNNTYYQYDSQPQNIGQPNIHYGYGDNVVPVQPNNYQVHPNQLPIQQPYPNHQPAQQPYPNHQANQQPIQQPYSNQYANQQPIHYEPQPHPAQHQPSFNQYPHQQPYVQQPVHQPQQPIHHENQNILSQVNNVNANVNPSSYSVPSSSVNQPHQKFETVSESKSFSVQPPVANAIPKEPTNKKNSHEQNSEQHFKTLSGKH